MRLTTARIAPDIAFLHKPKGEAAALLQQRRTERAIELCEGMIDLAAAFFNVSSKEVRQPGRTMANAARVRKIAMYVTHVSLGLAMNDIARGFGRDRTTVLYACHLIEDLRDDIDFDRIVQTVERIATAAFANRTRRSDG